MGRVLALLYGVVCYLIFFVTFLYAIGFVSGLVVPKGIDSGREGPLVPSLAVDIVLLGIFAVQHSLMARPAFKAWWTRIVPKPVERSTYVLFASAALILLFWAWRPLTTPIWSVTGPGAQVIWVLAAAGWVIVLTSTFLINHFDLFGLRQTWAYASDRTLPPYEFATPLYYRVVRHPIYMGFVLAFWAAPQMSLGHLVFAVATTAYIFLAIPLEEHDLVGQFGELYVRYRRQVSMIVPWPPARPEASVGAAREPTPPT